MGDGRERLCEWGEGVMGKRENDRGREGGREKACDERIIKRWGRDREI